MKRRLRLAGALFALSALVLLQAEALWASSACSMEMVMEMPVAAGTADADPHAADCPMAHSGLSHEHDERGSDVPECPLMPAGAASCVGGVALLPPSDAPAPAPSDDELSPASTDHAKDLLLAVSLLRPPRA